MPGLLSVYRLVIRIAGSYRVNISESALTYYGELVDSDCSGSDTHPYFAFSNNADCEPADAPADGDHTERRAGGSFQTCNFSGTTMNNTRSSFGVNMPSEFSGDVDNWSISIDGTTLVRAPRAGQSTDPAESSTGGLAVVAGRHRRWPEELCAFEHGRPLRLILLNVEDRQIGNWNSTGTVRALLWTYELAFKQS
ncbi:hypothetical protein ONZ51_g12433 [Trametes cubensis]|uniref:Uncharacterized protein n=1 Tax=Trametes cubensis TaxID=1111947 RepID=A0AAD7X4X1_9APHY|nr:hypothetical protein ONZ51_g12433 [Trametes cubensis]